MKDLSIHLSLLLPKSTEVPKRLKLINSEALPLKLKTQSWFLQHHREPFNINLETREESYKVSSGDHRSFIITVNALKTLVSTSLADPEIAIIKLSAEAIKKIII